MRTMNEMAGHNEEEAYFAGGGVFEAAAGAAAGPAPGILFSGAFPPAPGGLGSSSLPEGLTKYWTIRETRRLIGSIGASIFRKRWSAKPRTWVTR
jgi:hypothetical protein